MPDGFLTLHALMTSVCPTTSAASGPRYSLRTSSLRPLGLSTGLPFEPETTTTEVGEPDGDGDGDGGDWNKRDRTGRGVTKRKGGNNDARRLKTRRRDLTYCEKSTEERDSHYRRFIILVA